ncbi:MAG: ABC transporter ATP-binding protein [Granulosicoccus sp.]
MASITIKEVWKYYGKMPAVKDLNLHCADGEFVSILGPSGCGKSSTLRMLAGLEHISSGDVLFNDRRVNDLPPKDRNLAMVFENYALYPHKTVYQNMANALNIQKVDKKTIDEKVKRAAELLELTPLLDRKPLELSGGQKQRTAIGRAILREPELFLFDEPIAHLDAKLRAHMRSELKIMQRKLGTTMIYVTHDQLEALSMADRIAVMRDGVLQQLGTPGEIYNKPANQWVAGFIGEPAMNFLDCQIAESNGKLALNASSFNLPLTDGQAQSIALLQSDASTTMGIRPDDVSISHNATDKHPIKAQVLVTELLGGDMLVEAQFDDTRITVKTDPDYQADMGDVCYLGLDTTRWHLFDSKTGAACF